MSSLELKGRRKALVAVASMYSSVSFERVMSRVARRFGRITPTHGDWEGEVRILPTVPKRRER